MSKAIAIAALFKAAQEIPHLLAPGETVDEWNDRVHMIVEQNYEAAGPYADGKGWSRFEIALATTDLMGNETRFDRRIHAGEKHPDWDQDKGLAKCLGQHHVSRAIPRAQWERLPGLDVDATLRCAIATTMQLVSQAKQCGVFLGRHASKDAVAQAFAAYATGGHCKPGERDWSRALEWEKLMGKFGPKYKADVPGYRRAKPGEIPEPVKKQAEEFIAWVGQEPTAVKIGDTVNLSFDNVPFRWKLRFERHAEGKVGVSVFVEDSKKEQESGRVLWGTTPD